MLLRSAAESGTLAADGRRRWLDNPRVLVTAGVLLLSVLAALFYLANRTSEIAPQLLTDVLLYALLGSVYSGDIDGVPATDVLLSGLFGYGAATTAFGGLAIFLVNRREAGILKRLRATPLPPATYLAAVILSTLVVFAVQSVALIALGTLVFDASTPRNWLGLAGTVVLGVACFAGIGVGAAALIRSSEGVSAVVNVAILPMAFLSGSFGPTDEYPAVLQAVADVLPLTYFLRIVEESKAHPGRRFLPQGEKPEPPPAPAKDGESEMVFRPKQ